MKKATLTYPIMTDIHAVKDRLDWARAYYNQVTDSASISACIYEINALQAQYSHLLGIAKTTQVASMGHIYLSRFCR